MLHGEAVLLGVDGRSDFNGLHSRKHVYEVEFYAFDIDHEGAVAVSKRSLGDQRKPVAPVVAVAGPQPHALAVALDDQAVAVVPAPGYDRSGIRLTIRWVCAAA